MSNADLLSFLQPGRERGGVVLEDGTIVELTNHYPEDDGFSPDPAELLPHLDRLAATWHTHPGATANPSVEDAETFVLWPDLTHYIVGTDGVRAFRVKHGAVINA
jgi:proteasome lid subunit RPN8/RPN11